MIKLSKEDLAKHKGSEEIRVKMMCMICMTFPEIVIYKKNPKNWYQFPNPIPSNRLCFHIKHELECPCCEFGVVPEEKMQEMYFEVVNKSVEIS